MIHRRSRALLFWFLLAAGGVHLTLWWRLGQLLRASGLSLEAAAAGAPPHFVPLLSPHIHVAVVLLGAALATIFVGRAVVRPLRAIEEWLFAWSSGRHPAAMDVKRGAAYETLTRLLNELYGKKDRRRAETR